jgi:chitin disaccharide deacetylase
MRSADRGHATGLADHSAADRAVIFHADDVGSCHGANVAFVELSRRGLISCGSVMVPCPWFPEAAALARECPDLDLGVHLTLNSEWPGYRWRPISTTDKASGMIDPEGYFWRLPETIREHAKLDVAAAEAEFRAQIDAALDAGIDVTHIDSHIGIAVIPELLDVYVRLGRDYDLPTLLIRDHESYQKLPHLGDIDPGRYQRALEELEREAFPIVDHFRISPSANREEEFHKPYERLLNELPAGLTYLALHPSAPGDTEAVFPPEWIKVRTGEYRLLQDHAFSEFVQAKNFRVVSGRELRDAMRLARGSASIT